MYMHKLLFKATSIVHTTILNKSQCHSANSTLTKGDSLLEESNLGHQPIDPSLVKSSPNWNQVSKNVSNLVLFALFCLNSKYNTNYSKIG